MAITKRSYRNMGVWYAMGREDGGDTLPGSYEEFAAEYAAAREAYEDGSGYMPSLRRAFRMWQQGKPVTCED